MKIADDKKVARAAKRISATHKDLVRDLAQTKRTSSSAPNASVEPRSADKQLGVDDLSPDQAVCYRAMMSWIEGGCPEGEWSASGILKFAGLAGTGKTSVVGVLAHELQRQKLQVAYIAFTGRASSILNRKLVASGVQTTNRMHSDDDKVINGRFGHLFDCIDYPGAPPFVGTIHRLLYRPIIDERTQELLGWRERAVLDRQYDLIISDESSMIPSDMLADIQRHGVPLLAVGDHGQLPPVMGSSDLMQSPDLVLERIHRQAEGNPIIQLAHEVRKTGRLRGKLAVGPRNAPVQFRSKADLPEVLRDAYAKAASPLDVALLCWTNKTRIRLNSEARRARRINGPPRTGDVMLCLKNYPPVFNGMRGVVTEDSVEGVEPWHLRLSMGFPEEGIAPEEWNICVAQINRERPFASLDEFNAIGIEAESMPAAGSLFDFGYAMTVHKMQGSGVPHVVLYLDRPEGADDDTRRFFYTAVTRASERLTVVV
jgi:exodeoxyribonuclease-5